MAYYKVPQDVEADDKLIGPFSFRQFIYLIIVAAGIAIGWGLSRLFVPLAIIPLPIIIFFGLLALPLRKDQPMEIYLAAIVSFYLKPRKRLWTPDGITSMVEITAEPTIEVQRTKDLSQREAAQRLSYLADIVDTGGWAVRGVAGNPNIESVMQPDAFFEAQQTEDILDDNGGVAQAFESKIHEADVKRRQDMVARMTQMTAAPAADPTTTQPSAPPPAIPQPDPYTVLQPSTPLAVPDPYAALHVSPPAPASQLDPALEAVKVAYNPYPAAMHQTVVRPLEEQPAAIAPSTQPLASPPAAIPVIKPTPTTSEKPVSPDIINLAHNADLSIETIAHEAKRIQQEESDDEEVVISLR